MTADATDTTRTRAPEAPTIGDLAPEVRSKNAAPFRVTKEPFMRDADGYHVPLALLRMPAPAGGVS